MKPRSARQDILIIKLGALGDLIVALPAISQIVHTDTQKGKVYLLTSPPFVRLFQGWKDLHVQAFPRKGPLAAWHMLCWVRKMRFSRIYDLQSNDRTGILCALSGAAECVGNHPRFPYRYHPAERYRGQCHVRERLDEILASAGIPCDEGTPQLPVTEASRKHVENWLQTRGLEDGRFVILHAGANNKHPQKCWPCFLDLALYLRGRGLEILWTGGPDDMGLNKSLAASVGHDIIGLFSIQEEVELYKHARFAVTNDSAPMHILSCAGIPVYGIFGPTDWRRMHALGQERRVIALDKPPGNRENVFIPQDIRKIPLSMVIEKLQEDGLLGRA